MSAAEAPARAGVRYGLLALDLDGTVLDPRGQVPPENREAIARAREAGITVVVCTGRGLIECRHILEELGLTAPCPRQAHRMGGAAAVVAGGALIADAATGRTLHRFAMHADLASAAVDRVLASGHAALVLKDPTAAGFDYVCVTGPDDHPLDPVTRWWFDSMNVRVRMARTLAEDDHPEHTVRVGACGLSGTLADLRRDLLEHFSDRAVIHAFPAVVAPDRAKKTADGQTLHILELFDRSAHKWSAVTHLASMLGLTPAQIAAIGDEINDVTMIAGAGLGIAMGNAIAPVRQAARRTTRTNAEAGVAYAIDRILASEW